MTVMKDGKTCFNFITKFNIYHLPYSICVHDAFDNADPSSMQDAYHIQIQLRFLMRTYKRREKSTSLYITIYILNISLYLYVYIFSVEGSTSLIRLLRIERHQSCPFRNYAE